MHAAHWLFLALTVYGPFSQAAEDAEIAQRLTGKAQQALLQGDHESALSKYRSVVRLYPRSTLAADAWWQISRLENHLGDPGAAFDALQELITGYPGHFSKAHAEQFGLTQKLLDEAARKARLLGLERKRSKSLEEADRDLVVSMLERVVQNGPQSEIAVQARYTLGTLKEHYGTTAEAIQHHEEFLERYPDHDLADDAACQIAYIRYKEWKNLKSASPKHRDRAKDALTWFLVRYPLSERRSLAHTCLVEVRLSEQRELETLARYYEGQGKTEAAAIYRRELAEKFPAKGKL